MAALRHAMRSVFGNVLERDAAMVSAALALDHAAFPAGTPAHVKVLLWTSCTSRQYAWASVGLPEGGEACHSEHMRDESCQHPQEREVIRVPTPQMPMRHVISSFW